MPKIDISRSIEINASKSEIFKHLNDFNNWIPWSPWLLMEPEAKVTIAEDAKSYEWEGNRVGSGNMKVLEETSNDHINFELNFIKPWKSSATTNFKLEESGDGTKVTWTMYSGLPFFLFWMKKMMKAYVGADYERGLDMLKAKAENGEIHSKLEFTGSKQFEGCKWVGIKTDCMIDAVDVQMQADFGVLHAYAEENKENTGGQMMTIYHKWDIPNGKVSYTAALQVNDLPNDLPNPLIKGEIDKVSTYVLRHVGRYHHLGNAWSTLYSMIRNKELKTIRKIHPFELYMNNPQETAEKDLITDIYIPTK